MRSAATRSTPTPASTAPTWRRPPPASAQGCAQCGQRRDCQQLLHAFSIDRSTVTQSRCSSGDDTRYPQLINERKIMFYESVTRWRELAASGARKLRCASPCDAGNTAFATWRDARCRAHPLFVYGRGCKEIGGIGLALARIRVRFGVPAASPTATMTKTPWKSSPYLRCALSEAISHLLESLTFADHLLEFLTLVRLSLLLRCC